MTAIIFSLAFLLRLAASFASDIWYDEAYSLHIASLPIQQIIAMRDFSPPLWEIVLHPFVMIYPSVVTIRIIALVFSMLAMLMALRIAQALNFTTIQTTFALFIIAALPGITWLASDGRAYAMLTFFYLAGCLCVIRKNHIGLFAVSALMLYTHITSVFLIATLLIYALIRGEKIRRLALIGAGLLIAWLPWIFVMLQIIKATSASKPFQAITVEYFLAQLSASFWIGTSPVIYIAGLLLIGITIATGLKPYALILLPIILLALASLLTGFNLITYRTLSPSLMPFALLTGSLMDKRKIMAYAWLICVTIGAITFDYQIKGAAQAQAARMIEAQPAQVVYATLTVALPFDYYLDQPACILDTDGALIGDYSFGFPICTLDQLSAPYWFIMPDDPLIPAAAYQQMQSIAFNSVLMDELNYLQISPVHVYFVEK